MMYTVLGFDNEVFSCFVFYGGVVMLKTVVMGPLTSYYRLSRKVFSNEEDCRMYPKESLKPVMDNQEVERVRRCHQNDLENVLPFLSIGLLYVATEPLPEAALWLFRIFAASRLLHTAVYLGKMRQPARVLCFATGVGVNLVMLFRVLMLSQWRLSW